MKDKRVVAKVIVTIETPFNPEFYPKDASIEQIKEIERQSIDECFNDYLQNTVAFEVASVEIIGGGGDRK